MRKDSAKGSLSTREERKGFLEERLRLKTREWIEAMVNEELEAALGSGRHERRGQRRGYRKGRRRRTLTTSNGKHEITMPRGEYFQAGPDGKREWNSQLIPRYRRRTEAVEEALLRAYLGGTNTRRIEQALSPLLEGAALSKSTVSRIVARLSEAFEEWRSRPLSGEDIAMVYLDGFNLKLRLVKRVERIPVLCALGVRSDGGRVLLALEARSSESEAAWSAVTEDLAARGVKAPILAVIDGNRGLEKAVRTTWPGIDVQRCTKHKLENLATHAPKRHYEQIKADYHAIVYADSEGAARQAYARFERKWERDCPKVVQSLREAGEDLLTFFHYPKSMWKMLRTTNSIERLNEEFRRRVKTQGSLPNVDAGLKLLYGLFAGGLIQLRSIDGWQRLPAVVQRRRIELGLIQPLDKAA